MRGVDSDQSSRREAILPRRNCPTGLLYGNGRFAFAGVPRLDIQKQFGVTVRSVRKLNGMLGRTVMIESLITWLIIGAVAGWLAGLIVKGYGFGLVGNIVIGIIGAVIAGWLLPMIGVVIGGGIIAAIIDAVIGAVILLVIIGFFKKAA
jgi:uncharacterized membrane protein YeaQ/YmgE (transglycosylase-associated protein family)